MKRILLIVSAFLLFGCGEDEVYTEEVTYEAVCPAGYAGSSTVTKVATSSKNSSDARNKAQEAARIAAEASLKCEKIYYTQQATYAASCPSGYFGTAVSVTKTVTSPVSAAEAHSQALQEAKAEADEALECTQLQTPSGSGSCGLVQCLGKSKQNNPCKNKTTNCTNLCYLH